MKIQKMLAIGIVAAMSLTMPGKTVAQEKNWYSTVNFDPADINTAENSLTEFQLGISTYRKMNSYVGAGFGVALQENWKFKSGLSFPIFATIHAEQFGAEFTPTFDFRVGYTLNTYKIGNSAVFINPTIGMRYQQFGFGVGYIGSMGMNEGATWASAINFRFNYYFGAQEKAFSEAMRKFNFGVEVTGEIYGGTYSTQSRGIRFASGYGINASLLYPISDNFELGPMVGIHVVNGEYQSSGSFNTAWMPIALRGRYNVRQAQFCNKFYPWARLDLGAGIGLSSEEVKDGFYYAPMVGLSMDLKGGEHSLDLGLGYMSLNKYVCDDIRRTESSESVGSFQIMVGYTF
jgi:hypothetical protein